MSITDMGRRLKNARINAHMTQKEAADKLGITYQAISNYERGINRVDVITLSKLCALYDIEISEFLRTPAWSADMLAAYRAAQSPEERAHYTSLWGIPADLLEEENERREPDLHPLEAVDERLLYVIHRLPNPSIAYNLIELLYKLTEDGQKSLLDYASFIVGSGKYSEIPSDHSSTKQGAQHTAVSTPLPLYTEPSRHSNLRVAESVILPTFSHDDPPPDKSDK